MRKGLTEFSNAKFKGEDGYSIVFETLGLKNSFKTWDTTFIVFTSWCKFPFYEMNFGFGNPLWVANGTFFKIIFILLDSKCGQGIEAWVL